MDLNYLLGREQVALFRADRATSADERHVFERIAADCRSQIRSIWPRTTAAVGASS